MANNILVCDGDSITEGFEGTPYTSLLPFPTNWTIINNGIGGATLSDMRADAPTNVDVHYDPAVQNIVIIWGGTNDFAATGSTVAEVYAILQGYCADRHAVGWKVIVTTMLSRTSTNPVGGETLDTDKNAYNALIRANWPSFADGISDVAANANLGADGSYANTTYFVDGIHPTSFSDSSIITPIMLDSLETLNADIRDAMTITFDNAADLGNNGGTTNSYTAAYTVGVGTNRILFVGIVGDASPAGHDDITTVTYGGVALTFLAKQAGVATLNRNTYLYFMVNPASGSNNVVVSCTNNHYLIVGASSYAGAAQTGQPDVISNTLGALGTSTTTANIVTVTNNDWVVYFRSGTGGPDTPSGGAGATRRSFAAAASFRLWGFYDSNGPITPSGSYNMTTNIDVTAAMQGAQIQVAYKPFVNVVIGAGPLFLLLGCGQA